MQAACIIFALLAGMASAQSDNALNLNDIKANIPGLENLNEANLPQAEEIEKTLKEKCDTIGGVGTYDDIVASRGKVQECMEQHINTTQLMDELQEAKKDGSMDDVFGRYCRKRDDIMACFNDVFDKVEKCLEPKEVSNMKMARNISESLIDFACYKDGDRLAMFVAEGGFECLTDNKESLQECVNHTLSARIPKDISINTLPLFAFSGDSDCDDMLTLQKCAVEKLETCPNHTPANIVESLFKFIKKMSPCKDYKPGAKPQPQRTLVVAGKVKRSQTVDFTSIDSFRDKCQRYAGSKAFHDLWTSLNDTKSCIQTLLRQPGACKLLLDQGKHCISSTLNKLRACLPLQESYLPAFAMASVDNALDYLCDHNAYNYNRFMHGLPCLISSNYGNELGDCMANVKSRRTKDDNIVSKVELCEDMDRIKVCLSTYVTNHCAEMKDLKEVTMGLVKASMDPCAACTSLANLLLMIVALLVFVWQQQRF